MLNHNLFAKFNNGSFLEQGPSSEAHLLNINTPSTFQRQGPGPEMQEPLIWGWRQSSRVHMYHLLFLSRKILISWILSRSSTFSIYFLLQISSLWNVYSNHSCNFIVGYLSFLLICRCSLYFWTLVFCLSHVL